MLTGGKKERVEAERPIGVSSNNRLEMMMACTRETGGKVLKTDSGSILKAELSFPIYMSLDK